VRVCLKNSKDELADVLLHCRSTLVSPAASDVLTEYLLSRTGGRSTNLSGG